MNMPFYSLHGTNSSGGGGGGTYAYDETPSGSGSSFTLAHTPSPATSLILTKNGQVLAPGGIDYTLSGGTITLVVALIGGDILLAIQYLY